MAYHSLQAITDICKQTGKEFWQVILEDDMSERGTGREESMAQMQAAAAYEEKLNSKSGLAGGDGGKMEIYRRKSGGVSLCGDYIDSVIAGALQMGESNACMKRIVAAPTAGACGVLPAVLVPYFQERCHDTDRILKAMYVSAGIGQVIASRAYISGASGGCQAEIGSASAMAAGALAWLQGGSCGQIAHAAAMALKSLLGLVCDPVAGLVEVPCIKRNVIGAMNAMSCADMAMAGIVSRIPPDQVIDAMKDIGDRMDVSLKETALGGLARTPAAAAAAAGLEKRFGLQ